jgi:hypothetical protein
MRFVLRGPRLTVVATTIALLTALPMSALPLLHRLGDDDSCAPGAVPHDAAAHHIGPGAGFGQASHCLICHLWESARRFGRPDLPFTPTPTVYVGLVVKTPAVEPTPVAVSTRPARAPPVT